MILEDLFEDIFQLDEKVYKCSKGINRGKLVTSPALCADRSHTKKSKIMQKYHSNKRMMDKRGWYYET